MTDKTRDAFEAWARQKCCATDLDLSWNQHGYFTSEWRRAFGAWQAATLAALALPVQQITIRERARHLYEQHLTYKGTKQIPWADAKNKVQREFLDAARSALPVQPATDIHSCSFYCERPACVKQQRDALRDKFTT